MRLYKCHVINRSIMENNIKLNNDFSVNSYLTHFQVAQINFNLVIQEEPLIKRRFRRKYQLSKRA
jgi:hypothetical protein